MANDRVPYQGPFQRNDWGEMVPVGVMPGAGTGNIINTVPGLSFGQGQWWQDRPAEAAPVTTSPGAASTQPAFSGAVGGPQPFQGYSPPAMPISPLFQRFAGGGNYMQAPMNIRRPGGK